jgi:hypothetical protein
MPMHLLQTWVALSKKGKIYHIHPIRFQCNPKNSGQKNMSTTLLPILAITLPNPPLKNSNFGYIQYLSFTSLLLQVAGENTWSLITMQSSFRSSLLISLCYYPKWDLHTFSVLLRVIIPIT